jgi:hypothetical protein
VAKSKRVTWGADRPIFYIKSVPVEKIPLTRSNNVLMKSCGSRFEFGSEKMVRAGIKMGE